MVTYYINKDRKNRKLKRDFFFSFSLFLFSFFFWWLTIQLNGIRKLPPEKFPPGKPHQWNLPLVNSQKIPTSNIPTHVFKYSHRGFSIFCFFIITTVIINIMIRYSPILNLCIMSRRRNHLPVLQDKITVFCTCNCPKF